jgi:hypothetical protein
MNFGFTDRSWEQISIKATHFGSGEREKERHSWHHWIFVG